MLVKSLLIDEDSKAFSKSSTAFPRFELFIDICDTRGERPLVGRAGGGEDCPSRAGVVDEEVSALVDEPVELRFRERPPVDLDLLFC